MKKIIGISLSITLILSMFSSSFGQESIIKTSSTSVSNSVYSVSNDVYSEKIINPVISPTPSESISQKQSSSSLVEKYKNINANAIQDRINSFKDLNKNHWSAKYLASLSILGCLSGYKDKTIKPNNNMNVNEFLALTIRIMGFKPEIDPKKWDKAYIDLAIKEKLIDPKEYTKYDAPLTREQAVKIIVRAALKDSRATPSDMVNLIRSKIKDINFAGDYHRKYLIDGLYLGVIALGKDGKCSPKGKLTRAEASVLGIRILVKSERVAFKVGADDVFNVKAVKTETAVNTQANFLRIGHVDESETPLDENGNPSSYDFTKVFFQDEKTLYSNGQSEYIKAMKYLSSAKAKRPIGSSLNTGYVDRFGLSWWKTDSFGFSGAKVAKESRNRFKCDFVLDVNYNANSNGEYNPIAYALDVQRYEDTQKYYKDYFFGMFKILFPVDKDYKKMCDLFVNWFNGKDKVIMNPGESGMYTTKTYTLDGRSVEFIGKGGYKNITNSGVIEYARDDEMPLGGRIFKIN